LFPLAAKAESAAFRSGLSPGLDCAIDFAAVAGDHCIQLLLDFAQYAWRVNAGEVPVNVLIHDFD
jgi:hypothetical protein